MRTDVRGLFFAMCRFGPDVLTWTQCTTTREYLRHGLMQSSGYHIVTGAGLLFFSAIGKPSPVAFLSPSPNTTKISRSYIHTSPVALPSLRSPVRIRTKSPPKPIHIPFLFLPPLQH